MVNLGISGGPSQWAYNPSQWYFNPSKQETLYDFLPEYTKADTPSNLQLQELYNWMCRLG